MYYVAFYLTREPAYDVLYIYSCFMSTQETESFNTSQPLPADPPSQLTLFALHKQICVVYSVHL